MISDVLSEAVSAIEVYLGDPVFNTSYEGVLRRDIENLVTQMDAMRIRLDTPPTVFHAPTDQEPSE